MVCRKLLLVLLPLVLLVFVLPCLADSITYEYDDLYRLIKATYPDGTIIEYSYDAAGNRLSKVIQSGKKGVQAILRHDGAVWFSDTGWKLIPPPPKYKGRPRAVDIEFRADNSYIILFRDGAIYDSADGWHLETPPYYPRIGYAQDLELFPDGSYTILHKIGALWNSSTGWHRPASLFFAGIGYAVDLEYHSDGSYLILHRRGVVYDSATGWSHAPRRPHQPRRWWPWWWRRRVPFYAEDLELKANGTDYDILYHDGALWRSDTGWVLASPPYEARSWYALDLEIKEDDINYLILRKDGARYDSQTGWILDSPPCDPGTDWALDLEVQ
jgi:YD repeat-containing protein